MRFRCPVLRRYSVVPAALPRGIFPRAGLFPLQKSWPRMPRKVLSAGPPRGHVLLTDASPHATCLLTSRSTPPTAMLPSRAATTCHDRRVMSADTCPLPRALCPADRGAAQDGGQGGLGLEGPDRRR